MKVVTFKIDDEVLEELDAVASKLGISRSEVIRCAISEYLMKYRAPKPPIIEGSFPPRVRIRKIVIV